MINIKLVDILETGAEYTKNLPLAFLVGSLFVYEIFTIIPFSLNDVYFLNLPLALLKNINNITLNSNLFLITLPFVSISLNTSDLFISALTQISVLGQGLYAGGAILLLISSILLLLSMVTAIFAGSKKKKTKI